MLWRGVGGGGGVGDGLLLKNHVARTMTSEETKNRSDITDGDQATNWATKKLNTQTWHYILD